MGHAERNQHEGSTSNLYNNNLEDKDGDHDDNEQIVIKEVLEDVSLIFLQLSRIEEIEDL